MMQFRQGILALCYGRRAGTLEALASRRQGSGSTTGAQIECWERFLQRARARTNRAHFPKLCNIVARKQLTEK